MLLHVIDASDPHHVDRRRQVEEVLEGIGAGHVPRIDVYNKTDKASALSSAGYTGCMAAGEFRSLH